MPPTDTTPEAQIKFHELVMAMSPQERLRRACGMFSTAKALAIAGIRAEHDGAITDDQLRIELKRRFYDHS